MCLAVPAKIIRLEEQGLGLVDYLGSEVRTNFSLLPQARVGDWVIVHAGFAISVMDEKEARKTMRLFREMAKTSP
ncbi:MAG: HypC/HybG/HupF family hydrogenase formation chaperone [Candidatus Aminicenantales bacterium]